MESLNQAFSWILVKLIYIYRLFISPLIGPRCRFTPTCSQYGIDAIKMYGAFKGCWLISKRLIRCSPLSAGGFDPVPIDKKVK